MIEEIRDKWEETRKKGQPKREKRKKIRPMRPERIQKMETERYREGERERERESSMWKTKTTRKGEKTAEKCPNT